MNLSSNLSREIAATVDPSTCEPPVSYRDTSSRSPLGAAVLSFLWPGLGQLYSRKRAWAAVFALPVFIALGWVALQLLNGLPWFAASFLDESFALTFVLGGIFLGLWWVAAILHAFLATGRRRPRVVETALLAVLALVVLSVNGVTVYYAWAAYQFDVTVATNQIVANNPTPSPSAGPTISPTVAPTLWQPVASRTPIMTPAPSPTPVPNHHLTIMLAGLDWLPGRNGGNYDAMMLVSLDTTTHKVAMVSVPRDTAYFDYYWGGRTGINTKINNFANLVAQGLIHAPDPPLTALANELGYLIGIHVDYYAVVDMTGFKNMVDAIGGVCFDNDEAVNDPFTGTYVPKGNVCLDGHQALKYARSRYSSNDYVRAGRQQVVLMAIARKMSTVAGVRALPSILSLAAKTIQTNFPLKTVRDYVSIVQNLGPNDVTHCVLGPPYNYHPATTLTKGAWTSRLKLPLVAGLSVKLFGTDSRYYGMEGIVPAACLSS